MQREDDDIEWLDEDETPSLAVSSQRERDAVVASVLQDQTQREQVRGTVRPVGSKPLLPQLAALTLSTVLSIYLWFGSPSWLERRPPPPPAPEVQQTWVEAAVFLQIQQIEAFRTRNRRLPAFLEEAGPAVPGVQYARLDAHTYRIQARDRTVSRIYTSGEGMDSLGASLDKLLRGAGQ